MTPFILYVLKANGLLLLVLGFYFLFLRKETFFAAIRYYFLIGIACSFLLPLMSFTKTVYVQQTLDWSLLLSQLEEESAVEVQQTFIERLDLQTNLPYLFGAVSGIILLFLGYKITRLICHVKGLPLWSNTTMTIKVDATTHEAYSFWNWIILPVNHKEIPALDTIIQHERIHVQQKHTFDLLLVYFLRRIFWFNPLLRFLEQAVQLNLEYIVDQKVTTNQNSYDYQMTLVQFEQGKTSSLVNSFGSSDLKKRIIMLNQPKSNQMKKTKFMLCLPLAVGFFLLFQVKTKAEVIASAQTTNNQQTEQEPQKTANSNVMIINSGDSLNEEQLEFIKAKANEEANGGVGMKVLSNGTEMTSGQFLELIQTRPTEEAVQYTLESGEGPFFVTLTKEESKEILAQAKRDMENSRRDMENARRDMENAQRDMEASRQDMENARRDGEASRKERAQAAKDAHKEKRDKITVEKEKVKQELDKLKQAQQELRQTFVIASDKNTEKIKNKLFILDGKEVSFEELEKMQLNGGGHIKMVSKEDGIARYGEKGKNGVIILTSGKAKSEARQESNESSMRVFSLEGGKQREVSLPGQKYIVNGKEVKDMDIINSLDPNTIKQVNVIKGEDALKEFGEDAKNGVIIVTTKEK